MFTKQKNVILLIIVAPLVFVMVSYSYHMYLKNKCISIFEEMRGNKITIRMTEKVSDKIVLDFKNELVALLDPESVAVKSPQEVLKEFQATHQDNRAAES